MRGGVSKYSILMKWFGLFNNECNCSVPRYMPPMTPSSWKTIRLADQYAPVCPQRVPVPPNGDAALLEVPRERLSQLRRFQKLLTNQSEDCLYLNLYVPRTG